MSDIWEQRPDDRGDLLAEHRNHNGIHKPTAHSENCLERTFHCLSHVPAASLIAWILLLLGLGGLTGSLLVSADRTRDLMENEDMLWFIEYTCIGVVCGMFVIGTGLLVLGHFSSEPNCRHSFNSSSKNTCGRGVNMFMVVLSYILVIGWILATALLAIPVALITLVIYFIPRNCVDCGDDAVNCINLYNYGFEARKICGTDLDRFHMHGKDLLICYAAFCVSAIVITISLIHFLMIMSANITHLRDARFATMNAYDDAEDTNHAKQLNDTTM